MGARGKKSAVELSTIGPEGINAVRRPEPPAHLGKEAAELWRRTVNGRAADTWPSGSLPILEAYCVLSVSLRRTLIALQNDEESPEFNIEAWRALQKQAAEIGQRVAMLATKLRITPQSVMHPRTAGRAAEAEGPMPWEEDDRRRLWERPRR